MRLTEAIAYISLLVSGLSALYARQASINSHKANDINVHNSLKPSRLAVYNSTKEFVHFCTIYKTLQSLNLVTGTRDLSEKIRAFKWEVGQHNSLSMPAVEKRIEDIVNHAWSLQRILDRLMGSNPKPLDSNYSSAEDNLDSLIDWFAVEEESLLKLFEPYLIVT